MTIASKVQTVSHNQKKLNWNLNDEKFVVCVMPQWSV